MCTHTPLLLECLSVARDLAPSEHRSTSRSSVRTYTMHIKLIYVTFYLSLAQIIEIVDFLENVYSIALLPKQGLARS